MFVSGSSATVAYISQHGTEANLNDAYKYVSQVVGASSFPIVAPGLYRVSQATVPATFFDKSINIAWPDDGLSWSVGGDATFPAGVSSCSSFDIYDKLLDYFNNAAKFPNLQKVVILGFSAGGNLVTRYSTLSAEGRRFSVRYVIGAPASQVYFSNARPWLDTCSIAFIYPYQWVSNNMPRYVAAAFGNTDAASLMRRWLARDVVSMVGTADTQTDGTQTCGAVSSGGPTRRGRSYAYWAYKNLAAGTSTDVSAYQGYGNLTATGASTPIVPGTAFNHQNCIVANADHNGYTVFGSSCGTAALRLQALPSGSGPLTM